MNLPSIFKSAPVMKGSLQTPNNNKINNNVPQDMFGLGIQVFKIQSRKQIPNNTKSVGKMARQQIKAIENPVKRTSNIPQIPKPKKISAVLPSISRAPSQKQCKFDSHIKTDSIMGRKSVQKTNRVQNKMDEIRQYNPPQTSIGKNIAIHKSKTMGTGKTANKSMDAVPQVEKFDQAGPNSYLIKQQWRQQLNTVRHFLTQARQFHNNQTSKVGRRKNQEYLGEQTSFVDAYVNNQETQYGEGYLYDPFSIQNYNISKKGCRFQETHYQDHVAN